MKRMSLFLCLILLCGCFNTNKSAYENSVKYENYLELIIDNSKQVTTNIPFDWNFNMYKSNDQYAYEVSITDPKVAMSNIQFLAVNIKEISEDIIAPCVGIFEENTYNMIPNQANAEKDYYGAIGVNGITDKSKFTLNCLVVYKDKFQSDNYVYFIINADYADFEEKEVDKNE